MFRRTHALSALAALSAAILPLTAAAPAGAKASTASVGLPGSLTEEIAVQGCADCVPASAWPDFTVRGSATLRSLTSGSLPLSGGVTGFTFGEDTQAFTADLTLGRATAKLISLGFMPVTAEFEFVPTAPVSGTLVDGRLSATAKMRIKLPKLTTLGIPIAGLGTTCQARQASAIPLASVGSFSPLGGTLAGSFSISDLASCGGLNGLVNLLTAGSGNAITLQASPTSAG